MVQRGRRAVRLRIIGLIGGGAALLACIGAPVASAAPANAVAWSIRAIALPTSFQTGDTTDRYALVLTNVGGLPSHGPVTVSDTMPAGVVATSVTFSTEEGGAGYWSCGVSEEGRLATCTTEQSIPALAPAVALDVHVVVSPSSPGPGANEVKVTGGIEGCGGGGEPCPTASGEAATSIDGAAPAFGPLLFEQQSLAGDGQPDLQAGEHPNGLTTALVLPSATSIGRDTIVEANPVQDVKQIVIELPPGEVANAQAAPTCSLSDVTGLGANPEACPLASHVGTLTLVEPNAINNVQIINVTPETGYPVEFATYLPVLQRAALLYGSLGPAPEYRPRVTSAPLDRLVKLIAVVSTFFGDPEATNGQKLTPVPLLTNPSDCSSSALVSSVYVDSWELPASFNPDGSPNLGDPNWRRASSSTPPVVGCGALQFHPTMSVRPDTTAPGAPAALSTDLKVPQNEAPHGLATPPLEDVRVALPTGLSISPSSAGGLQGCSNSQFALSSSLAASCPASSQIGTVTLHTPILAETLEGQVFLGDPECDPCTEANGDPQSGRMVRLFIQVHSEHYGLTIKLPGNVSVNPASGQLTATFKDSPQEPFDDLKVDFKSGPRAALSTPRACGTYSSTVDLTPWSAPATPDATLNPSFEISGCGGAAFAPSFSGGTTSSQAGSFAPFTLTFSRQDSDEMFNAASVTLPPGVTAKLAGVPLCPEAAAAAGTCPAESRVGSVTTGAGPGSEPYFLSGQVFLTGPYKGGPYGLAIEVPAVAGPFNLGTVVVRQSLHIDPRTAQVTDVSDPFPQILDGIPLQVRTVNVTVDRPSFMLNSTSCAPMQISGTLTSTEGLTANETSPFQVANCAALPFGDVLTASTQAKTSKVNGASLHVRVASGPGQAGIAKTKIDLPLQLPSRLSTLNKACLNAVFVANPATCPAASVVGSATIVTPLLAKPLSGPVYLVSHGGAQFPDTVIVLQGEGITVELEGQTNIKKGITSSSFEATPDEPFTVLDVYLPEGPHSILAAYGNLCSKALNMPTKLTGQNGVTIKKTTRISVSGCPAQKKKTTKRKTKRTKRRG